MQTNFDPSKILFKPVKVTFLEMHEPKEMPARIPGTHFELLPKPVSVKEYRTLYYGVGEKWNWLDRMVIPDDELFEKINGANIELFIFYVQNEKAGFIEFIIEPEFVEILYFGLMPGFIGKGMGKYFLQWVVAKAWSYKPEKVQLNTCTLDHPNALSVYKNAGFKEIRTEMQQRRILE